MDGRTQRRSAATRRRSMPTGSSTTPCIRGAGRPRHYLLRRWAYGFRNKSQATAERIVDGWAKTGDIGRLDANRWLCMLDRIDGAQWCA